MYKNLVFAGGGVKSYAYVGALEVLERKGVLHGIEKVAGSSAGALYATLVGLNFSVSEIKDCLSKVDVNEEINNANTDDILKRFFDEYGQYTGATNINAFRNFISYKVSNADITFKELHDKKALFEGKDIYLTGVDVSEGKLVIFSYEDTPDMRLIDAIRISNSYPLMYTPVNIDGHCYADGGLLDNYPISIFNDQPCEVGEICKSNPETLGLFLGTHEKENALGVAEIESLIKNIADKFGPVDADKLQEYLSDIEYTAIIEGMDKPISDIVSYIGHLFYVYSLVEYKNYNVDEILINDNGLNALELDITDQQIQGLISNGKNATEDFLNVNRSDYVYSEFFI